MLYQNRDLFDLVRRLSLLQPALVVLESTGGLERPLARALSFAGLPVAVVNPRQVRDYAGAVGKLAKTDGTDDLVLAQFAHAVQPEPRPLLDKESQALRDLLSRRQQLRDVLQAEKNQLRRAHLALWESIGRRP